MNAAMGYILHDQGSAQGYPPHRISIIMPNTCVHLTFCAIPAFSLDLQQDIS